SACQDARQVEQHRMDVRLHSVDHAELDGELALIEQAHVVAGYHPLSTAPAVLLHDLADATDLRSTACQHQRHDQFHRVQVPPPLLDAQLSDILLDHFAWKHLLEHLPNLPRLHAASLSRAAGTRARSCGQVPFEADHAARRREGSAKLRNGPMRAPMDADMTTKPYRPWAPHQPYLLPPSPADWLPKNHLAYFLLDLVAELDLSAIEAVIQA